MNEIVPRDIINFKNSAECLAAKFCHKRNISGVIVKIDKDLCEIIVPGFEYSVFARINDINLVAKHHEVPVVEGNE
jgi:hypothetical protein